MQNKRGRPHDTILKLCGISCDPRPHKDIHYYTQNAYIAVQPPSITNSAPVMNRDSSDARNSTP
jgi:hypothetical protein